MLTDDAFARLVAEDVKNRVSQEQKDFLRLPENWERWRESLLSLLDSLEEQLQGLDEELDRQSTQWEKLGQDGKRLAQEGTAAIDDKRKKASRFKFHVEQRLAEVDRLIAFGEENLTEDLKLASFLTRAIGEHKKIMYQQGLEPTSLDEALWASIHGVWEFDRVDLSDL